MLNELCVDYEVSNIGDTELNYRTITSKLRKTGKVENISYDINLNEDIQAQFRTIKISKTDKIENISYDLNLNIEVPNK